MPLYPILNFSKNTHCICDTTTKKITTESKQDTIRDWAYMTTPKAPCPIRVGFWYRTGTRKSYAPAWMVCHWTGLALLVAIILFSKRKVKIFRRFPPYIYIYIVCGKQIFVARKDVRVKCEAEKTTRCYLLEVRRKIKGNNPAIKGSIQFVIKIHCEIT